MTSALQKRKRWAYLLSLLTVLLVAGVGATLWLDNSNRQKQQLNLVDVKTMQWRRPGFEDIVFSRHNDNDTWQIESPCSVPANSQRLEPLFSALANLGEQYATDAVDLEAAGLVTPLAVLMIDGQELAIGEKDLSGTYRYLRHGSRVALIPEWILSLINSGLTGVSALNIFDQDLTTLARSHASNTNQDSMIIDADAVLQENLTDLQANQIVLWPITDMPEIIGNVSLDALYKSGKRETLELTMTQSFAAIRRADNACAYLLEPDAVPDSMAP